MAELACQLVPLNWRACLNAARINMSSGNLYKAREYSQEILADEPANFAAMRHLSIIAFRQRDRLEGCFLLWRYDDLFRETSSLHDRLIANCPKKWLTYFRTKRPQRYYPRYNDRDERVMPRSGG
jgi:hypothetical protein